MILNTAFINHETKTVEDYIAAEINAALPHNKSYYLPIKLNQTSRNWDGTPISGMFPLAGSGCAAQYIYPVVFNYKNGETINRFHGTSYDTSVIPVTDAHGLIVRDPIHGNTTTSTGRILRNHPGYEIYINDFMPYPYQFNYTHRGWSPRNLYMYYYTIYSKTDSYYSARCFEDLPNLVNLYLNENRTSTSANKEAVISIKNLPALENMYYGSFVLATPNPYSFSDDCFTNMPNVQYVYLELHYSNTTGPNYMPQNFYKAIKNLMANNDYVIAKIYCPFEGLCAKYPECRALENEPYFNTRLIFYDSPNWSTSLSVSVSNKMLEDMRRTRIYTVYPSIKVTGNKRILEEYYNGWHCSGDGTGLIDNEYPGIAGTKMLRPRAFGYRDYYSWYFREAERLNFNFPWYLDLPDLTVYTYNSTPPSVRYVNMPKVKHYYYFYRDATTDTSKYPAPYMNSCNIPNDFGPFCKFVNLPNIKEVLKIDPDKILDTSYNSHAMQTWRISGSTTSGDYGSNFCIINLPNAELDFRKIVKADGKPPSGQVFMTYTYGEIHLYLDKAKTFFSWGVQLSSDDAFIYFGPDFHVPTLAELKEWGLLQDTQYNESRMQVINGESKGTFYIDVPRAVASTWIGYEHNFCGYAKTTYNYKIIYNDDPDWVPVEELRRRDAEILREDAVPEHIIDAFVKNEYECDWTEADDYGNYKEWEDVFE